MRMSNAILAAFFLCSSAVHAEQTDLFNRANESYATGKYANAARDLEELAGRKELSAPLFFNLGNAYFRDGRTGLSILNYERAFWLNPGDPDTRANLRFVRKTAGLFEPTLTWWQVVPGWMSLDAWSWIACASWFLLVAVLILRWWKREAKWTSGFKPVTAVLAVTLAVSLSSALIRLPDLERAVVLAADAPLRVAPLEKSPAPATLRAGDLVQIENRHGPFFFVETEDGKTGWATDKEVEPIISHF